MKLFEWNMQIEEQNILNEDNKNLELLKRTNDWFAKHNFPAEAIRIEPGRKIIYNYDPDFWDRNNEEVIKRLSAHIFKKTGYTLEDEGWKPTLLRTH